MVITKKYLNKFDLDFRTKNPKILLCDENVMMTQKSQFDIKSLVSSFNYIWGNTSNKKLDFLYN